MDEDLTNSKCRSRLEAGSRRPRERRAVSSRNGGTGKRGGEHARRSSSRADICAVCLDGFRAQEKVIWLPCAHRYHASCVLPWLADHSHCPYCRTEVPALDWRSESVL